MAHSPLAELEARGLAALRDPRNLLKTAPVGNREFILQLWRHPAFDSWMSWTVYSPWHGRTTAALVRRTIWDCHRDRAALSNPVKLARKRKPAEPTVYVKDADLEWKQVESWLASLAALRLPLTRRSDLGLDGESNGLRYGDPFLGVELRWSGSGPKEWKDLLKLFERIREACEILFQ
jgi:hypothetical protein